MKEGITYEEVIRWLADYRVHGELSADRNNSLVERGEMTMEEALEEYKGWRGERLPLFRTIFASLFEADPVKMQREEISLACKLYRERADGPNERLNELSGRLEGIDHQEESRGVEPELTATEQHDRLA